MLALAVAFVSDDRYLLSAASIALIGLLFAAYVRRLLLILKPSGVFDVYRKIFSSLRQHTASHSKVDDEMRALALTQLSKQQLQQWKDKLEFAVLFNRAALFSARRLKDYQNSGIHILSGVLTSLSLVLITTFSFSVINYSLYKIDSTSFEALSPPSFFTFLYYSFNTFLFNSVKDLAPASIISQSAAMLESLFALFLIALFISLVLPFKSQRYTAELTDTIDTIETEGRSVESFIKSEYHIDTVDAALIELQKLEAGMIRVLLFLSEDLK